MKTNITLFPDRAKYLSKKKMLENKSACQIVLFIIH